jgi:hypothetical protein
MKKQIVTTLAGLGLFALATTSYGQGQIQFQNSASTSPITFGAGTGALVGEKEFAPAGTYTFGLYVGPSTATSFSQLTLIDTVANPGGQTSATSPFAGAFNGGTITGTGNITQSTITLAGGTTYAFEAAGWTTTAGGDYLTATGVAGAYVGLSGIVDITVAANPTPVVQGFATGNLPGFSIQPIPEPSTIILGGLGAAALLAFRRRNK